MKIQNISDLLKTAKKIIKANVVVHPLLRNILCKLGLHQYKLSKYDYTYINTGVVSGLNRRAKTKIEICKHCNHQRLTIDTHNTIL